MVNKSNLKAVVLCAWVSAFAIGLVVGLSRCSTLPPNGNLIPASVSSSPGTVNNGVSPVSEPVIAVTSSPKDAVSSSSIDSIVNQSACTTYSWPNGRGKLPRAAVVGIANTFVKSLCAKRSIMTQAVTNTATDLNATDGFAIYHVAPTLPNLYALMLSSAAEESSGKFCEGYDTSVSTHTSTGAEGGILQQSFDLMGSNSALTSIYSEYQAHPDRCDLSTFSQGVSCHTQSIIGSGPGADFQRMMKSCPALAIEQGAIGFRVRVRHWGPARSGKLRLVPECVQMFQSIQDQAVCK